MNKTSIHKAPINVMHFVETLGVGGMENGVVNIANYIDTASFRNVVCCFGKGGELAKRLRKDRPELIELGYGAGKHLDAVFGIAQLFRRNHVDIVHTHGWGARCFLAFSAACLARVPFIINGEHGTIYTDKWYKKRLQKIMSGRICGTLSVSHDLKTKLISVLDLKEDSITVIPNGVDTDRFTGDHDSSLLRSEFAIPDGCFVISVIGSLKWQKNQRVVLEALKLLRESGFPVKLLLVGDGPDRPGLEALARQIQVDRDTIFIGIRDDIPQILSLTDIVVLPSVPDYEGMSNVILEAMSSLTPVISSHSIGASELIKDGVNGLLFHYDQPASLAEKIKMLIEDRQTCLKISGAGKEMVSSRYSIEIMVKNYESYYKKIYQSNLR